jgi:hypothetical protein
MNLISAEAAKAITDKYDELSDIARWIVWAANRGDYFTMAKPSHATMVALKESGYTLEAMDSLTYKISWK